MTLVLRYAARSDRGLVRQNNQDSVYAGPRLLALADGMGGHAAGEVASKVVVAAFAPLDDDEPGDDLLDLLRDATDTGNNAISDLVGEDPELEGMGTTLTAILFAGNKIGLAHVGDSRAYLMRDGKLTMITHDDTFVQSLIDEGRITEEEASNHPQRSLLLKALTGHEVDPSLTVRETRAGDRFLLCSDGLSGVVSHETLEHALTIEDPQRCADRLIELALKGGGPDNVTCIVADVHDVGFGDHAPIVGGAAGDGFETPQPDSAAARASATLPRPDKAEPEPEDPAIKRRRRRRRLIGGFVVLFMLLAAAGIAYWAVQRQYYVSAEDDGRVVIYRGVSGSVLGIDLHKVEETSCPSGAVDCEEIRLSDLNPAARGQVAGDIQANDGLDDARRIIERLRTEELLPPCSENGAQNGQPPSTTPAPPVDPNQPPADPNQPPVVTPPPAVPGEPLPPDPNPADAAPATPGPETALPEETPTPGVDCRMVR